MPVISHLGPATTPCGLTSYASPAFGPEYRHNLFACCFNQHRITRHVLNADQSMYQSQDSDFVVSDNVDFHPTDILEDADGSLLIMDTGACTSCAARPRTSPSPTYWGPSIACAARPPQTVVDPRGAKIIAKLGVTELGQLLADERPLVQERATKELAQSRGRFDRHAGWYY